MYRIEFLDGCWVAQDSIPVALSMTCSQLGQYFDGIRRKFDLRLKPQGTQFQLRVWGKVGKIKFGKVKTYFDLAIDLGDKGLLRAVGGAFYYWGQITSTKYQANFKNPMIKLETMIYEPLWFSSEFFGIWIWSLVFVWVLRFTICDLPYPTSDNLNFCSAVPL